MSGTIHSIYIASNRGDAAHEADSARLTEAIGLEGDRHANSGVVTLIELEEILEFNNRTGLEITAGESRRNIVTQGIRLNDLVGKQFWVGDILLEGFELCEPCATLGRRLSTDRVSGADVVKAFTHNAGIRAFVRGTGEIAPGTSIAES
jgi:MOSC domain-containing protein YiiM